MKYRIPQQSIDLVKKFEGCSLVIYGDVVNKPTIGYGHLIRLGENLTRITQDQADDLLCQDLSIAMNSVLALTKVALNDNQLSALISFVFNLGAGCFQRSTLRMKLNRGDYIAAANDFTKYDHADGEVYRGLFLRRKAESNLFKLK